MVLASHDADANVNSVKWLKKSCCISFQSSLTNKATMLLMIPSVPCDANTGITSPKKSCFTLFQLSWLDKQNGAMNLCHIMLGMVLIASHDQKNNVTPCFMCVHLMNKMMLFMIHLASPGNNAGINAIVWLKSHVLPHIEHCNHKMQWWPWQHHWHHKDMSRHCLDNSRHCLDMSRYIDMSSHFVDTYRHFIDIQIHLDMSRNKLTLSRHMYTLSGYD